MEVVAKHIYAQNVDAVFKHFADSEQVISKYNALGARSINLITLDATDTGLESVFEREVPADVPKAMKRFLGEWNHVKQTESWSGTPGKGYKCDIKIEIKGVPVSIGGTLELVPEGDGCVNNINLSINCGIPLVGKKLAEVVGSQSRTSMEEEYQYIKTLLGQ